MCLHGPNNVERAMQIDPTLLCCALEQKKKFQNKRNVGSCWLKQFHQFQTPTTRNNMQQGVQMDTTCNIPQCWELLANTVVSICTVLIKEKYSIP